MTEEHLKIICVLLVFVVWFLILSLRANMSSRRYAEKKMKSVYEDVRQELEYRRIGNSKEAERFRAAAAKRQKEYFDSIKDEEYKYDSGAFQWNSIA